MHMSFVRLGFMASYLIALLGGVITAADVSLDPTGHATGWRPPTAEEQAWLDDHVIVVDRVYPNALAVSRLQGERQRRGLAAGPALTVAETGAEFSGSTRTGSHQATARLVGAQRRAAGDPAIAARLVAAALPTAVDNSAEKWFPPIGDQGRLGSCYPYSVGYYLLSFQIARDLDRDLRDFTAPDHYTKIFSPRFLYNMSTTGTGGGTPWSTLLDIGCPTWASVPYTDGTDSLSCGSLPTTAAIWREAIPARIAGLRVAGDFKQELANGNLISFGNAINSWQYRTVGAHSDTRVRSAFAGQSIAIGQSNGDVNHAMTLVGYDDGVWVDLNSDGAVQSGELGAYKIANQWGTGWGNRGFMWVSYTATQLLSTPFILSTHGLPAPTAVAEVTLVTGRRSQFKPRFAVGTASSENPTVFRSGNWEFRTPSRSGGALTPFDGGTVASEATLAFDLTDLTTPGTLQRFFLFAEDTTYGDPLTITRFQITDAAGNVLAPLTGTSPAGGLPRSADASRIGLWADAPVTPANTSAPVITSPSRVTGAVGQQFVYAITATNNPLAFATGDLPLGLYVSGTTIYGSPLQAGTFRVSVHASNLAGGGSATIEFAIASDGSAAPVITSPSTVTVTIGAFPIPIYRLTTSTSGSIAYAVTGLPTGYIVNSDNIYYMGSAPSPGIFPLVVTAAGTGASATKAVTLTVLPAASGGLPRISSMLAINGTVGQSLSYQIVAINSPTSFAASGLPAGLTINAATGRITGVASASGAFAVTLSATNGAGSVTEAAQITIGANSGDPVAVAPAITAPPANLGRRVGQTAMFTVAASGTPTPTIQWQRSPDGSNWTAIGGATSTTYTTATLTLGDNGARFRAVATNGSGSATSTAATLTVRRRGDVNMDGAVDISDLILVKQAFGGTTSTSDLNGDGAVDISDLILVKQEFGL